MYLTIFEMKRCNQIKSKYTSQSFLWGASEINPRRKVEFNSSGGHAQQLSRHLNSDSPTWVHVVPSQQLKDPSFSQDPHFSMQLLVGFALGGVLELTLGLGVGETLPHVGSTQIVLPLPTFFPEEIVSPLVVTKWTSIKLSMTVIPVVSQQPS